MPCNSDYLEPTWSEKEASRLLAVADEILHGKRVDSKSYGNGMRNGNYASISDRDALVRSMCAKMKESNPSDYSLEVQMWWRDHQEADAKKQPSGEGI